MFNLQGSELIIILLLALVVLGPEKLPDAMRKLGQLYAEIRKMSSGFQEEFRSVMDEPVREMRDTANLLRDSADFTKLQDGEREEKPKSAEMPTGDEPEPAPTDDVPFREHEGDAADADPADVDGGHDATEREAPRPRPFSGNQLSSAAPKSGPPADPSARGAVEANSDGGDPELRETGPERPFGRNPMSVPPERPEPASVTRSPVADGDEGATDDVAATAESDHPASESAGDPSTTPAARSVGVDGSGGGSQVEGSDAPGDPTR